MQIAVIYRIHTTSVSYNEAEFCIVVGWIIINNAHVILENVFRAKHESVADPSGGADEVSRGGTGGKNALAPPVPNFSHSVEPTCRETVDLKEIFTLLYSFR